MAKYYNVKEAAAFLGLTEDAIRQKIDARELYGYRDGMDWKFKAEDIEKLAADKQGEAPSFPQDSTEEVLLSEVELGQSGIASGTVIGMEPPVSKQDPASDFNFLESGLNLAEPPKPTESPSAKFEELDMTLDEDISLEESVIGLDSKKQPTDDAPTGAPLIADSEEDMVIGGSGSGLTLGGDSGISLVDPADSGISLEQPLNLGGSGTGKGQSASVVGVDDDDMLSLVESAKGSAIGGDDDFMLTPAEEADDGSDSGSQVIALEDSDEDGDAALAGMPILSEDFGAAEDSPLGAAPLAVAGVAAGAGFTAAAMSPAAEVAVVGGAVVVDAPYSGLQITSLVFCVLLMFLGGMMTFDMLRNMWGWSGAVGVNSAIMDFILSYL